MKAVWFVRSRQFGSALKFALAIISYDPNDTLLSQILYLVYAFLFFSVWGLAVLAWFASGASALLQLPGLGQPSQVAGEIMLVLIAIWWVATLLNAIQHSPARFDARDAMLICMTPVSRPAVIFAGFANSSLSSGAPFWAISTVLAFGMADIRLGGKSFWAYLPDYLGSALRFLLPVTLLVLAMLALAWALGCFRLQGSHRRRGLALIPVTVGVVLGIGILSGIIGLPAWQVLAVPAGLPLLAGSGAEGFLPGLLVSVAWLVAGVGMLYWTSRSVSLARMAQPEETGTSLAESMLIPQVVQERGLKKRLSGGHTPSRLPPYRHEGALLWKKVVQSTRRGLMRGLASWLVIFGLGLGILVNPDGVSRWLMVIVWIMFLQSLAARDLVKDLELWPLSLGLPFRPARMLLLEVLPAALLAAGFGWAAMALYQLAGWGVIGAEAYLFLPVVLLAVTGAAAFDVAFRTKAGQLLAGNVPAPGRLGLALALIVVVLNALALSFPNGVLRLVGLVLVDAGVSFLLPRLLTAGFRKIGR